MVGDQPVDRGRPDEQRLKNALRHPRFAKDLLDRQRRLRHVGGVLEQHHVAGDQRGQAGAKRLPERKVPRHHGQNDAERLEPDIAFGGGALGRFVGQQALAVLGQPVGGPGALFDLRLGLDDGLAHLSREQGGVTRLVRPQHAGDRTHERGPHARPGVAPRVPACPGARESALDGGLVGLGERGQLPACGRIY